VLFDARADRVYAGGWLVESQGYRPFLPPTALTLGDLDRHSLPEGVRLCGSGAERHAETLEEKGFTVFPAPLGAPSAAGLIGVHRATYPARRPRPLRPGEVWTPDYLRPSQPERLAAASGEVPTRISPSAP
jgi:hypothetical protein